MLKKTYTFLFIAFFSASASFAASPPTFVLAKEQSKIEFVAHTKNSDVVGAFSDFAVSTQNTGSKLTDMKVKVTVTTSSLNTRNSSRDKHLRQEDFFWSDKYPVATFETTKLTQKSEGVFQVDGVLILRGVTKSISFETRVEQIPDGKLSKVRLKGEVTLNRQEFGITYQPFFLLPRIKDDVQVKFELVAISSTT